MRFAGYGNVSPARTKSAERGAKHSIPRFLKEVKPNNFLKLNGSEFFSLYLYKYVTIVTKPQGKNPRS